MNSKQRRNDKRQDARRFARMFILVALAVLILLTLGYFLHKRAIEAKQSDLEKKKSRLKDINNEISRLQPLKEKTEMKERFFFLVVRIIIAAILIFVNCAYFKSNSQILLTDNIGILVDLNTAILLAYSFAGFIRYGSLEKLVNELKAGILKQFRKYHVEDIGKLAALYAEREYLIAEISDLEGGQDGTQTAKD